MKNAKIKKTINATLAIILILTICAQITSAEITATVNDINSEFCLPATIEITAKAELTECEQLNRAKINIGNKQCTLPTSFGHYFSYGTCGLDVRVTETNPDNCYNSEGQDLITYLIEYDLTSEEFDIGTYPVTLYIKDEEGTEVTSSPKNLIINCETTTTTTSTTTTSCTATTCPCSTTTTTSATTTTLKKKRHSNNDGIVYPIKPNKIIASCNDSIKNLGETDIDCGGENCPACDDGKHCLQNRDCKNQCINGICQTPSCTDGYTDQDETDVDCGGKICDKCENDKKCIIDEDCLSSNCDSGICREPVTCALITPNCTDSIRNQDETDVDCGGSACDKCDNFMKCAGDNDCKSGYCHNHICATPTCTDGVKNQNETNIDCGGPCKACETSGGGLIGYVTALSGGLANILLVLIVLLLLGLLGLYLTKKRKYVAAADYLEAITDDAELERFINKNKPGITASTSRKIRRIKKFLDNGKIDIVWIKDWDYINELILKGLDDNSAESIALAKQMNSGLFIKNEEAKKIAEEAGIKVYTN
jgi:hypothetical protein